MPAITTTLVFSIGPAVAKALLSQLLKDKPVLGDLAPGLLDWLTNKAKAERRDAAQQISAIGETVAARLRPMIAEARLHDNDLAAVLHEFIATLDEADVDAERLVKARLDRARLVRGMLRARPEATTLLSAGGAALYERLVREASAHLTAIAAEFVGFNSLLYASILQDQERILNAILAIVQQPAEDSARFEKLYHTIIQRELNKLEMFGVPRLKDVMERQPLDIAYVTVEVQRSKAPRNDMPEHDLLESILDESNSVARISDEGKRVTGPINDVLARERRIVVRGEAGSGKTTLLRWLAVMVAEHRFDDALSLWNNAVPFYVRLRKVDDSGFPTPEQYVAQVDVDNAARQPSSDWAHQQLENGRAVLLIDGIDELPKGRREAFLERLQRLVRNYPNARYVVTSRPAATSRDNWPEWFDWANDAGFAEVMIQPMDDAAIEIFIDHWHKAYTAGVSPVTHADILQSASHLKRLLPQRPPLHKLADNPLLCSMICALHLDRQHNLPPERLKLYAECVDMMLEQRDIGRKVDMKDYPPLGSRQKQALLQDLAYRMMRNEEIELSSERVDELFAGLLPSFGANPADAADVRAYFVERSSMLREPVLGQIDFMHRTFQEFFAAQAIAEDGEIGYLFQQASKDQWRDTFPLAAGMLRPREVEDLLKKLIADGAPLPQRALAVACLETTVKVEPALRQQVFASVPELFPPYHPESQRMLVATGEHAIPYLTRERQSNIAAMVVCIRTLALIGGEKALVAIETYKDIDHDAVREVIDESWQSFDHREYARRLLKDRRDVWIGDVSLLSMLVELPQLQQLDLSRTPLSDLSGLAQLPQLQQLNLSRTPLSDLSGLAQLPQLQQLDLSRTQVNDLASLPNLPQLQQLDLSFTQVGDLSPLAALAQLQRLNLSRTPLSDLSGLTALAQLQTLNLSRTPLSDLSGLTALGQLRTLNLNRTQVGDLGGLGGLVRLETLDLSNTQVDDLSVLEGLVQLQTLYLSRTQVGDLGGLGGLVQLETLDLSNTEVGDLSLLARLVQLQTLDLTNAQMDDLSGLAGLAQLKTLDLSNTQVDDLSSLAELTQLQRINLSNTQVDDLNGLEGLAQLQRLDLIGTPLSDLSELGGLVQLQRLDLSNTQVSDLSGLGGLVQLQRLDLSNTQVSDLSGLEGLVQLETLDLTRTLLSDLSQLPTLPQLQQLILSGTPLSDLKRLPVLAQLQRINLSRTQVSDLSGLTGLAQLQELDLSGTRVSDLSSLSQVPQLQWLNLSGTSVSDLSVLAQLPNLERLYL